MSTYRSRIRTHYVNIEKARRAALAMLAQLKASELVAVDLEFDALTTAQVKRWDIEQQRIAGEVARFLRSNFERPQDAKLPVVFDLILASPAGCRLPRPEFDSRVGALRRRVTGDAPQHSSVHVSLAWGLQFQFPERHFAQDCALAYRQLDAADRSATEFLIARRTPVENPEAAASIVESMSAFARFAIHSCYSMVEAFINGVGWAYLEQNPSPSLAKPDLRLLEGKGGPMERIRRVPEIVSGRAFDSDPPFLLRFEEDFKTFRDDITHVFDATDTFARLHRIYDLDIRQVRRSIDSCILAIGLIQSHISASTNGLARASSGEEVRLAPSWLPTWDHEARRYLVTAPHVQPGS